MRRREFIAGISVAAIWPVAVRAQQPPRIGYLSPITSSIDAPRRDAFLRGLREQGYVEGQSILIEWRFADGILDRLPTLARELLGLNVRVVVAAGGDVVTCAVMNASTSIATVMTNVEDPIGGGLIASLARPGGNVTGLTALIRELSAKRLELLKEIVPGISSVLVFWNPDFPGKDLEVKDTQTAAMTLGIYAHSIEVRSATDIESAFQAALADAVITLPDPLTNTLGPRIIELAATRRIPAMFSQKAPVDRGGLVSYGPSYAELFRRAAVYVDKILKGARPADLPVEQPTKLELIINLRTAKALGLIIPPTLLARADEVIE